MATIKWYGKAGVHLGNKDIAWTTDTIKLALATSAYAFSQSNDEFFSDVTNEIAAGGGYTAGGFALTTKTRSYDATTREERFLADNINVAALTPASAFRYGIIYQATGVAGTSILIANINFGTDQNPAGLPFVIQWAATGVLYAQAS
jgi:hypothetical protein